MSKICCAFAALPGVFCLAAAGAIAADVPAVLPGTSRLAIEQPLDVVMVDGINRFALQALEQSPRERRWTWASELDKPSAYDKAAQPARERLRTIIGAVDTRVSTSGFEYVSTTASETKLAESPTYTVHAIRWRVLDGVTAEGILLNPKSAPKARIVALPDADWTPEAFAGLVPGVGPLSQIPRRLAESGAQVVVPTMISRDDRWSGNPAVRFTNEPHREYVYRMGFELGRHVIGYEVQKVLAAVDIFSRMNAIGGLNVPIGAAGVSEGGLVALYSAALDSRVQSVLVSGYFQPREGLWQEPIYRNVWSLLTEFGDAEIASLVLPRNVVIEAARVPQVTGPPAPHAGRGGAAPGVIATADPAAVRSEFARLTGHILGVLRDRLALVESEDGRGPPGSPAALERFLADLGSPGCLSSEAAAAKPLRSPDDVDDRQHRQVDELVNFTQELLERSARVRDAIWSKWDVSSKGESERTSQHVPTADEIRAKAREWEKAAETYRDFVWRTLIGKLPDPAMPPNVRTRKVLDDPAFTAYEVALDVYPDVIAGGILLLPTDLKPGERRPVVVCQHGLEGVPMDTITTTGTAVKYYKGFTAALARRGFITFAPQNPYRGGDRFRSIQRKSNLLGRSLFSYIIPQHERLLDWLSTLPNVDATRIGFYGLSYGGKTAVRVPTLVPRYALSICSGDFNEWVRKNASSSDRHSYVFTPEYEIFEWNMGHVANYAELASLMGSRPFMVERGHEDGVAPDEWVAWEYAKVRRHYDRLGLGDKTEIEFFNGPHTINGRGTYAFLEKHLGWSGTNRKAALTQSERPSETDRAQRAASTR